MPGAGLPERATTTLRRCSVSPAIGRVGVPGKRLPVTALDVVDAAELAELLQFLSGWIAGDPARLAPSLLAFVGHPPTA